MLALILFAVIVYIVLGIVGFVVHGLFWLVIVAALLFLLTVFFGGTRVRRRRA